MRTTNQKHSSFLDYVVSTLTRDQIDVCGRFRFFWDPLCYPRLTFDSVQKGTMVDMHDFVARSFKRAYHSNPTDQVASNHH